MKILFVYTIQKSITLNKPLKGQEDIQMGVSQISAVLKKHDHKTSLLVLDRRNKSKNFKLISNVIETESPEIICFTAVNSEIEFVCDVAHFIKENYGLFMVLGGVHVTISPKTKYLEIFDVLCIGEGEFPMLELADKLENKEDISDIQNLWIKKDGITFKNTLRPFINNLNELPFVDREIWQPWILEKNSRLTVLLGRGCPYNCTYCCNHKLRKITSGNYVRMRSAKDISAEIKLLVEQFPVVTEYFLEIETLSANIDWLVELCEELYILNSKLKAKLSFGANLRVYNSMNFELVFSNLSKAGFSSVIIGLESGSEKVRSNVLNRHYSNKTIVKAVETARGNGLKIGIFNLIGLPGETITDFQETIKLNQLLQPDWHATSIFYPYEGTELFSTTKAMGLLPETLNTKDERQHAVLDLPGFSKKEIQKHFDHFHFEVYRKNRNRNMLKLSLYFIQTILGHNFMANSKIWLFRISYQLKIKSKLFYIIQKT